MQSDAPSTAGKKPIPVSTTLNLAPQFNRPFALLSSVHQWFRHGEQIEFDSGLLANKLLVLFLFQSWCQGCHEYGKQVIAKVNAHFQKLREDRVEVVAIQTVFEGRPVKCVRSYSTSVSARPLA